jgi:predicted Fe-Mo cluster-binding NifX family protein
MKVLVTSTGESLDSAVDPQFGRAKKFLLVDTESGEFQTIDNAQNVNAVQGAGIQAGQTASQHGAQVVITGNCGPNAFRTLQAAGVEVIVGAKGTVGEAVEKFKAGELKSAESPNVQGHWA